jgi:predicted P-loop ATPase/GTPase
MKEVDKELDELASLKDRIDKLIDIYKERNQVIEEITVRLITIKSAISFTRLYMLKIYPMNFEQLQEAVLTLKAVDEAIEKLTKLLGIEKEWKDLITDKGR